METKKSGQNKSTPKSQTPVQGKTSDELLTETETSSPTPTMTDTTPMIEKTEESTDPQLPLAEDSPASDAPAVGKVEPHKSTEDAHFDKLMTHIKTKVTHSAIAYQLGMLGRSGGITHVKDWPVPDRHDLDQQILARLRQEKYARELYKQVLFLVHQGGGNSHLGNIGSEVKIMISLVLIDMLNDFCPRKTLEQVFAK